jgi:hypothetical protein
VRRRLKRLGVPPVTTMPLVSRVAVWTTRAVDMLAVGVRAPEVLSWTSALDNHRSNLALPRAAGSPLSTTSNHIPGRAVLS